MSPCLFNLHAEYIMRNSGLEETQAGIKIAGRNINNLRYANDTTLMAESEEELQIFLMKRFEQDHTGTDRTNSNTNPPKFFLPQTKGFWEHVIKE